jgi:hypothetical protein
MKQCVAEGRSSAVVLRQGNDKDEGLVSFKVSR